MFRSKMRVIIPIIFLLVVGCSTLNIGQVPWALDIQNWSSYQKANFFMNTWMAEKRNYDSLNAIENKPSDLIDVLKTKREIIEKSRVPIRWYVEAVNRGETPNQQSEQEIIDWLRQLQQQVIYR